MTEKHDTLHRILAKYVQQVPPLLRRCPLTSELADEITQSLVLNESPFTVAVVGPMRTGKSTLINALAGADLALPGVTETTATVNWFCHGTAEESQRFRVIWNDVAGSSEEFPLSEQSRWVGNSELAKRTRYLQYFSPAPFLKTSRIVDTPGVRSTLESHELATREFLLPEDRAERDSLHYGGAADCIIYVLSPVMRGTDRELLSMFGTQQRLPQSTPFNSIGVLSKWETLTDAKPWEQAELLARRTFDALKSVLCDVIPVSGPLGRLVRVADQSIWDDVLRFAIQTPTAVLKVLMLSEEKFTTIEQPNVLSAAERVKLRDATGLPRECFRTLIAFAKSQSLSSGLALKDATLTLSGLPRLHAELENRFFSRSRMIRTTNVIWRSLRVADRAWGRIHNRLDDLREQLVLAEAAHRELMPNQVQANEFLHRSLRDLKREFEFLELVSERLERPLEEARDSFSGLSRNLIALQQLEQHPELFQQFELTKLKAILGDDACDNEDDVAGRLSELLLQLPESTGLAHAVLTQAICHLDTLAHSAGGVA